MKYLCGDFFKSMCGYSVGDYTGPHNHRFCFKVHEGGDKRKIFVKTEYLNHFFQNCEIKHEYILYTHNSDINITADIANSVLSSRAGITEWRAQNVVCSHPKLTSIPIGIANPKWAHGNQEALEEVQAASILKDKKIYVNFDLFTNQPVRSACLRSLGMEMEERTDFPTHLRNLARSYFCVSPDGNGIDCHRHWECFYLRTIPIMSRSFFSSSLEAKGLPVLIVDDWADVQKLDLSPSLYKKIWGEFATESINSLFLN